MKDELRYVMIKTRSKREVMTMDRIIFLDIDGVISPTDSDDHQVFNPDKKGMFDKQYYIKKAKEYKEANCMDYLDSYDMYVVETYWSTVACAKLKELLEATNSKLVMESSWIHSYGKNSMPGLLKMAGLEDYYLDIALGEDKLDGILKYLKAHPEIKDYIIIDDEDFWHLGNYFGHRFIQSDNVINDEDCVMAKMVLENQIAFKVSTNKIILTYLSDVVLMTDYHFSYSDDGKLLIVDGLKIMNKSLKKILMRYLIKEITMLAREFKCDDDFVIVANKRYFKGIKNNYLYTVVNQPLWINHEYKNKFNQACLIYGEFSSEEKVAKWQR